MPNEPFPNPHWKRRFTGWDLFHLLLGILPTVAVLFLLDGILHPLLWVAPVAGP